MKGVFVAYEVIEHYADEPPEPYGHYLHETSSPSLGIGDVIELRWLDGKAAYNVQIEKMRNGVLHVVSTNKPATHIVRT